MELNELRSFVMIADQGSFTKAADALGYSQAAITIQMRKLEKELGVQLFERLGKKISMTAQGKLFYEHAINILNEVSETKEIVREKGEPDGTVHIGTIDSLCSRVFPALLKEFRSRYPKVRVNVTTDTPKTLLEMLAGNEIDIVYLLDEEINDSRFRRMMGETAPICFAASTDHPVFRDLPKSWEELLKHPFALTEKDASYRKVLDYRMSLKNLEIVPDFESNSTDLLLNIVRAGGGITFLPKYVLDADLSAGTLKRIMIPDFDVRIWRQLLVRKGKWMSRELQAFADTVMKGENSDILPFAIK